MESVHPHTILVVDDNQAVRHSHARLVKALGYEVETAADGLEALGKLELEPDLILLDAEMPLMDGFEVAEQIRDQERYRFLPIVMVTGLVEPLHRRRALSIGVNDLMAKPIEMDELALKARWLLALKRSHDLLARQRDDLERAVEARTAKLRRTLERVAKAERTARRAHTDTVRRLMIAAEYRDTDTAGHLERIGRYSEVVARALGLPPRHVELIRHAAPMHDVGKIGIPDRVLLKPARLDEGEWRLMRSHTTIGREILTGSDSPLIRLGEVIAASHHERWDGSGYPDGLVGEAIPLEGRICAVVDYFDALTTDRPYRSAVRADLVVAAMKREAGHHFDPAVLSAFLEVLPEVHAIRLEAA